MPCDLRPIISTASIIMLMSRAAAFTWPSFLPAPPSTTTMPGVQQKQQSQEKATFLTSLNRENAFNTATKQRTELLNSMVTTNPTTRPGSVDSFQNIAPGTWQIVYAPHISTLSGLLAGSFDPVLYKLNSDGTIVSHAKYSFPIIGQGWLSVSGTYGSEDGCDICRVDFDRAWIEVGQQDGSSSEELQPIGSFDDSPDDWYKGVVNSLGQMGFRREFAVFPVSYLDNDTIVFDFELFGTRICARKV